MLKGRMIFGLVLLLGLHDAVAVEETNLPPMDLSDLEIRLWQGEVEVRGGLGYKDNITLSSTDPQSSAFWLSGLEALAFRLPAGGWQFSAFLEAADFRYFDAPEIDNEQQVMAVCEATRDLGKEWSGTLGFNYLFQNQVFDFSTTYTNQASIGQIVGHTLTPRVRVRKEMGSFWVETDLNLTRQFLQSPLDNFWLFDPGFALGHLLGSRGELRLAYRWSWLDYDTRLQVDSAGIAIPDSSLALQGHVMELVWRQAWDEKKRWQTSTRAGVNLTDDNGSGFYDFRSYRLVEELRFRDVSWDVRLGARISHYQYPHQSVSRTDPSNRERTVVTAYARAERTLTKHFSAFADYSWDNSISNLSFDDYQASVVFGGIAANF
jgi:hypothetical protein